MKIYTSYFANVKNLAKEGIVPIGIALYKPRFYSGLNCTVVSPTKDMLHGMSDEEYTKRYYAILEKADLRSFLEYIKTMGGGKDVALCCYEKPGDFCHRHLLAEYITRKTGIEVTEFEKKKEEKPAESQGSLFK